MITRRYTSWCESRNFVNSLIITAAALTLAGAFCFNLSAQQDKGAVKGQSIDQLKPLPPGGPAPRTPDGHPDLSGHWFVGLIGTEDALLEESDASEGNPYVKPFDPKVTPEEKP